MPDIGIGALGYVGYAPETTEGVAVAPTKFLAANSINWDDTNAYNSPLQIRGERDLTMALAAPFTIAGSMEMLLVPNDVGNLLKSAFAATVNSSSYAATSAYSHVFTPAAVSPTMTFETSYTGSGGAETLIMRHTGIRVNTMELRGVFGEPIVSSFGFDGVGREKRTVGVATPSYDAQSLYPFVFNHSAVDIASAASALVKEFTFGVNNNVEHIGTIRRTRSFRRVALGQREMTLSMSLDFESATEYDRFLNDTEFAVALYMDSGQILPGGTTEQYGLKIELPRVKYEAVGIPLTAADYITQDVECTIRKPNAAAIATITLANSQDGTVAFA